MYAVEDILEGETLFYRVHKADLEIDQPVARSFRQQGDGMSCDWAKYSSAEESLERAADPLMNAIVSFATSEILPRLALQGGSIVHDPIQPSGGDPEGNQAHSLVHWDNDNKRIKNAVRALLALYAKIEIPLHQE